jgi:hypothetical protein
VPTALARRLAMLKLPAQIEVVLRQALSEALEELSKIEVVAERARS